MILLLIFPALKVLLGEIGEMGLTELRLQQNQFSPKGCEFIAEVLAPPPGCPGDEIVVR